MKVSLLMTRAVETVSAEASLRQTAEVMGASDVGFVPVVQGGSLVGVVTDRDLVLRGLAEGRGEDAQVSGVMSREVLFCGPDDEAEEAAALMAANQVRRLPVLDERARLVGVLALADLARGDGGTLTGRVLQQVCRPGLAHDAPGSTEFYAR